MEDALLSILIPVVLIGGILLALSIAGHMGQSKPRRTFEELNVDLEAINDLEFQRAVQFGQKMNAMKRYRALTNVELSAAQEIVEYLEGHPERLKTKNRLTVEEIPSDEGLRDLLRTGKRMEAIDIYRQFTGSSLSEAKEAIERIEIDMNQPFENERESGYGNL